MQEQFLNVMQKYLEGFWMLLPKMVFAIIVLYCKFYDMRSGIRYARGSGIGNERDILAAFELIY